MDLRLARVPGPLHLTDRHRLFSATRQDWIPTSNLRVESEHCVFVAPIDEPQSKCVPYQDKRWRGGAWPF